MKCYEPFAGIGGIGLGLESIGWETVAYSEFDPEIDKKNGRQYAEEVMAARFPGAVSCGDIREIHFTERGIERLLEDVYETTDEAGATGSLQRYESLYTGPIGIVAGGFPCTDISSAGKQAGIEGERSGLWKDMHRCIAGLRPAGVLIENVAALAGRGLDVVLKDLAEIGYDCEWDVIAAAGVGAPHLRERMFIIAWPHGAGHHGLWPEPPVYDCWLSEPEGIPRLIEGGKDRPARLRCLGNSVVPQVAAHVAALLMDRIDGAQSAYTSQVDLARRQEGTRASLDHGAASRQEAGAERARPSHRRESAQQRVGESDSDGSQVTHAAAQADLSRSEGVRELRSGIHSESTQAETPEMLQSAVRSGDARSGSDSSSREPADTWDVKIKRGDWKGASKRIGTAADIMDWPGKFPRAGRMTDGVAYERERSCTQKHAKATGLAHIAATLRPSPDDHPELPHTGLVPTPNASVANDGEGAETWIERKLAHASKAENPTRASMPLSIYAQVKLVPTPTAKDADCSRSSTAIRATPPARESQMGETLTDYVDPTNGGRLLPTPCAADANGSRASKGADRPNEGGLLHHAKLLPTPTTQDAKNNGAPSQMDRNSLPLNAAAKLLPTPRASENENRQTKRTPSQEAGTHGLSLGAEVGTTTPTVSGRLNPAWVSWLMGFPIDWLDLT